MTWRLGRDAHQNVSARIQRACHRLVMTHVQSKCSSGKCRLHGTTALHTHVSTWARTHVLTGRPTMRRATCCDSCARTALAMSQGAGGVPAGAEPIATRVACKGSRCHVATRGVLKP